MVGGNSQGRIDSMGHHKNSVYVVPASGQQRVLDPLVDIAELCSDDNGPIHDLQKRMPEYISSCDFYEAHQKGIDIGIEVIDKTTSKKIFLRREDLVQQTYKNLLLRTDDKNSSRIASKWEKVDLEVGEGSAGSIQEKIESKRGGVLALKTVGAIPNRTLSGTAFIIRREAQDNETFKYFALTNAHVVDNPQEEEAKWLLTTVAEEETIKNAVVVGVDQWADVAVLSFTTERNLPVLDFGSSENLSPMQEVYAIGNTLGVGIVTQQGNINDISKGIPEYNYPVMQTDVATNKGNSGCPILAPNMAGEMVVVGMHFRGDRGNGTLLGFEIPVERIKKSYDSIMASSEKGALIHGDWGMTLRPINTDLKEALFSKDSLNGVQITNVYSGSSAEKAGVRAGDILLSVNRNNSVVDTSDEQNMYKINQVIADSLPGQSYQLELLREGKPLFVNLTAGSIKDGQNEAFFTHRGFTVYDISDFTRRKYQVPANIGGVWVSLQNPKEGKLYDYLGNLIIITHVNGIQTPTVESFRKVWEEALKDEQSSLLIKTYESPRTFDSDGVGNIKLISIPK